ncbi:hypothetical protein F5Y19DRAFT_33644 [Xylariaceae sp. FL1651]|nr:hypothetical protein F5Y19DRAFT_33644 [Xylariaceae sp. FL1651]
MLTDKEIDEAAEQLAGFRTTNPLEDILQRYDDLLISYRRLKSDYEEEKAGRERYKQLARGQERKPFVLVLVDGDGYIFNEDFFLAGAEGGSRVAQQLNETVKASLKRKDLDNCEIVVRIYANLTNLSKIFSKYGLAGPEKRSLAPFVGNFNRSYDLTDFVDAGELKEGADFKLRGLFRLYAENAQCKHIYFAACHDVGYVSELTGYRGDRKRLTLVRSPGLLFHGEFSKLDLNIEELPGVFRSAPLEGASVHTRVNPNTDAMRASHMLGSSATVASGESQKACPFYTAGKCRFGKGCKNAHIDTTSSLPASSTKNPYSFQQARQTHSDNDFTNGYGRLKSPSPTSPYEFDNMASYTRQMRNDPSFHLPKSIPDGYIALNKHDQRLDAYMAPPPLSAFGRLKELSEPQRFCNNKQLTNSCPNENCEYRHDPLPKDLLPVLEWLSRSLPCTKRDKCRNASCVLGHICQNMDCVHRGGKSRCKLPESAHSADFSFDHYAPGSSSVISTTHNDATDNHNTPIPLDSNSHTDEVPSPNSSEPC